MPKQHRIGKSPRVPGSGLGKRVTQRDANALDSHKNTLRYPMTKEDVKRLMRRAGIVRLGYQEENYEILSDVFRVKAGSLLRRANYIRMLRGAQCMLTKDDIICALRAGNHHAVIDSSSVKKRRSAPSGSNTA